MFHADLHVHSRFSRACSKDSEIPHLAWWAARKGVIHRNTADRLKSRVARTAAKAAGTPAAR